MYVYLLPKTHFIFSGLTLMQVLPACLFVVDLLFEEHGVLEKVLDLGEVAGTVVHGLHRTAQTHTHNCVSQATRAKNILMVKYVLICI